VVTAGFTSDEWVPGLTWHAVAGLEIPVGAGILLIEGRYQRAPATLVSAGSFDYGGLSAFGGLRIAI